MSFNRKGLLDDKINDFQIYVDIMGYLEKILYYKIYQNTVTMLNTDVYKSYLDNLINLVNVFVSRKMYIVCYDLLKYIANKYNYGRLMNILDKIKNDDKIYVNAADAGIDIYPLSDTLAFVVYMPNSQLIVEELLISGQEPSKNTLLSAIAANKLDCIRKFYSFCPSKMETLMYKEMTEYAQNHNRILILEWFRHNEWPMKNLI